MLSFLLRFFLSKAFWINAVIAFAVLFFAGKWTLGYLEDFTLHGESITVPDFKGVKIEKLEEFLADTPLQYLIIDSVYKTKSPRGCVYDQDPAAGTKVKKGRKVYLTVNAKMPLKVALPDLTDVTLRQATAILEYYGLRVGNKKYIPDQCFNCVLRVEIEGNKVDSGMMVEKNTSIDLILGQGQSSDVVQIPDLYGKTLSEAQELLTPIALNFLAVNYDGCKTSVDSASARVLRQVPVYEKDVAINLGSTINVWLTCDPSKVKIAAPDSTEL